MNDYSGWSELVSDDFDDFEETLSSVRSIDSAWSECISADEFQDTSRGLLSYGIKGPPFLRHVLSILESHAPGPLFQSIANYSMQLSSTCGQDISVQNVRHFVLITQTSCFSLHLMSWTAIAAMTTYVFSFMIIASNKKNCQNFNTLQD